jgi:hypothetical protein
VSVDVGLSDLRNDLKKIGCKLKSQLDGSWAICAPKGVRTIVATLDEVQAYITKHTQASEVKKPASLVKQSSAMESKAHSAEKLSVTAKKPEVTQAETNKIVASEEQKLAIAAVNKMLVEIREHRLKLGLNFLHSEIPLHLKRNGCPKPLLEKAISYTEAKLQKDCLNKLLFKRAFKNYADHSDIMYFDSKYAELFVSN